jgi:uncharacterized protein
MTFSDLALLCLVYFGTSVVSVVTGGTSLITVPVLLAFGVEPRTALATNMLALACLSGGAAMRFIGKGEFEQRGLPLLLILTLFGSVAGALLVFAVPETFIPIIVAAAMLIVGIVMLRPTRPAEAPPGQEGVQRLAGYVATLLLAIYGGFFSGGYVTLLTAAWVTLLRMPLKHSIATTKLANLISCLAAVTIFGVRGAIDWRLGALLSTAAFLGALVGARWTLLLSEVWLRWVFIGTVLLLAFKTLIFDVRWNSPL